MLTDLIALLPLAAGEPAGGAAMDQVIIATAGATVATAVVAWLAVGHRNGSVPVLGRLGSFGERVSGLPPWAAVPSAVAAVSLLIALLGMYWDISLHIDLGRDEGPLANPSHYLILIGLFGVFTAGVLAVAMPVDERPGPAAVKLTEGWYAPVGGLLMVACGAFSLVAFPLDDVWHRLFGQDVTLWGPTHLMLIGGAGFSLVGQSILLAEGMSARRGRGGVPAAQVGRVRISPAVVTGSRRIGLMGGFLIGLSTFQAEFDFGVPQFDQVFQPMLIALAAGIGLVAARLWIGPGGALGAVAFFLVVRGIISLIVGPILGETTPSGPLYVVEAACVEVAALALARSRPLALGAVAGALIGTVGFAAEYAWTQVGMRLPWNEHLLPEGVIVAILAGVAGGLVGALFGLGLRGELPRPALARAIPAAAFAVVAAMLAYGLTVSVPERTTATVTVDRQGDAAQATVRFDPRDLADDARWVNITAWQGGGLRVDELERVSDGVYRTTKPFPVTGDWKSILRVHRDDQVLGVPVYMPADPQIPAPGVPASPRFERTFLHDHEVLQREKKDDVPGWLWSGAIAAVFALYTAFLVALAWGVGRVARRDPRRPGGDPPGAPARQPVVGGPAPIGA